MRSESTVAAMAKEPESTSIPEVSFPAGNSDFRAVRNQCARACREFNSTPDDADPEERSRKWLDIVRPDRNRDEDGVAVTHDQTFANPALKAKTPFVKPPLYVDYGTRLHVGGSTFINRGCTIMDTPVADVVIGEGCNIGPNCTIIGVSHPLRLDERQLRHSIGQPVTIGNDVWIGANVTILGGVTIGDGAVIGACSLVKRDIPPMTIAFGSPARVVGLLKDVEPSLARVTAETLAEATGLRNRLPMTRLRQRHGFEEDAVVVDRVPGDRFDDELTVLPDSPLSFSDRRSSSNTLRSDGLGSDGEMRMLMALRQREQRLRRCEGNVLAAGTVIATLFIAFFFAGVYLGATRGSVFGGRD